MFNGVIIGIRSYFDAHRFIIKHKLWFYIIAPGIINLLLFIGTLLIGWHYSDLLTNYFLDLFGMNEPGADGLSAGMQAGLPTGQAGLPTGQAGQPTGQAGQPTGQAGWNWAGAVLRWFFMIFFRLLFVVFYLYIYKYVILIIMSPVMALLSEKVDKLLTGQEYPFVFKQFVNNVLRGIVIAIRNLVIEFAALFLLFLLSFIPVLGWFTPFLMLIVEFFFFGFSMIDYSNELHKMSVRESSAHIYNNKGLAVAIGGVFYGLLLLPVVGLMVGPGYGVIAATLSTHQNRKPINQQG